MWYHKVTFDGPIEWSRTPIASPMHPHCPVGMDPEVFFYYMEYCALLSPYTFGRNLFDELNMFLASAAAEINSFPQARSFYRWLPGTVDAARLMFGLAWVLKTQNPVVEYNIFEPYSFQHCFLTYLERIWDGWQETTFGDRSQYFDVSYEIGDYMFFMSRAKDWVRGWPDRLCTCYKWLEWGESDGKLVVKLYFRAAMIFLGMSHRVAENKYRLSESYRDRALIRSPSDVWKGW